MALGFPQLFLACGWYGALGRVVDFEMCHLRSRGRVANFKNEVFRNGGIGFEIFDFLTCCTWKRHRLHMLSYDRQGGVGGDVNVRVERFPHGTEEAHVAFVVVWSSGGVGGMLTFVSSTSFTLQKRLPLLTSCIVWRAFCGFPAWTYVGRGWISSRTIIAGTQQLDGTWKHLKKWRPQSMLHKRNNRCTKNGTVMLTAGLGVTTLPCYRL